MVTDCGYVRDGVEALPQPRNRVAGLSNTCKAAVGCWSEGVGPFGGCVGSELLRAAACEPQHKEKTVFEHPPATPAPGLEEVRQQDALVEGEEHLQYLPVLLLGARLVF